MWCSLYIQEVNEKGIVKLIKVNKMLSLTGLLTFSNREFKFKMFFKQYAYKSCCYKHYFNANIVHFLGVKSNEIIYWDFHFILRKPQRFYASIKLP